jgi:hypothetical protein
MIVQLEVNYMPMPFTLEADTGKKPFAMVVQAHLAAQTTKDSKSQERRRKRKFLLMKIMFGGMDL